MNKEPKDMTLAELVHARAVIVDYILQAVVQARRGGTPWSGIASSLGVSTSEAHRRYSWVDKIALEEPEPTTGP